jgi:hypothetical protein
MNGVKIPGPKASLCEVEISCELSVNGEDISKPNFTLAPKILRGGLVGNSEYVFELTEDIDFADQFNSDGYSNRKYTPIRNANGIITGYKITKSTVAVAGRSKIYKKVLTEAEVTPFMEIVLPEKDIMNVESIIFKENPNFKTDPKTYEFFIDAEEYMLGQSGVTTYRYFEVDSLADQYRFGTAINAEGDNTTSLVIDPCNPEIYVDYSEEYLVDEDSVAVQTQRYYQGQWKPISQKFITEYTDNGYLKIIFGSATDLKNVPSNGSSYADSVISKMINNDMLGLLPKAGWTMYVLYRVGGGSETNLAQGAINKVLNADVVFKEGSKVSGDVKSKVIQSLSVYNPTTSVAGKDAPSTEELKYIVKYSIPTQKRCVTLKDYKSKIMQIDPKFGCPFRCNTIEENNKILIPMLGLKYDGTLESTLPQLLIDNVIEWLTHYKNLTDFVEFRSGRIYNLGFEVDVFVDKNYSTSDVIASIIDKVYSYMDVSKHDMGEDIFIGDLEKNINELDGVLGLIDLRVFSLYDGKYGDECQLPTYSPINDCCKTIPNTFGSSNGGKEKQIDINAIDGVLSGCYDGMYEIKHKETDIHVRVKLR